MRKLSDIKGEDALDILADLIEPAAQFAMDDQFVKLVQGDNNLAAVKYAIKSHKKEVLAIMAILEGEDPKNYTPPLLRLPVMLLELLNDPELISLFQLQGTVTSSGPAMESTEETGDE